MAPKIFISYSWTSPKFREQVRLWADRLAADGVDIILDHYDLKEGHDKYAYMEKMVTDPSVTHVLMFIDKKYAEKADSRSAGVGTESQIISKEVYEKVAQSKFVPIACELNEKGEPYLPVFASSRIYVDFSSDEAVNRNWESLVRLLHGKPLHEKPQTGKPPAYITDESKAPSNSAAGKFAVFKNAYISGHKGTRMYRQDFLDSCANFVDALRPRTQPEDHSGEKILATFRTLTSIRNLVVDWVFLEAQADPSETFSEALVQFLERLLDLRGRPREVSSWNDAWYEGHELFVYETFLYVVATLLKSGTFGILNTILMGHYLRTESDSRSGEHVSFTEFYSYCEHINAALLTEVGLQQDRKYHSQAAELLKRSADRTASRKQTPLSASPPCYGRLDGIHRPTITGGLAARLHSSSAQCSTSTSPSSGAFWMSKAVTNSALLWPVRKLSLIRSILTRRLKNSRASPSSTHSSN